MGDEIAKKIVKQEKIRDLLIELLGIDTNMLSTEDVEEVADTYAEQIMEIL